MINGKAIPQQSKLQQEIMKIILGNPSMDAFACAEVAYDALLAEKKIVDDAADDLLANAWRPLSADSGTQYAVDGSYVATLREARK
jgi:hypothetical protein